MGLDPRRKNATRESTSTLKAWLYEHIKNPYPTKGEKIMLAIITKMTLTQVNFNNDRLSNTLRNVGMSVSLRTAFFALTARGPVKQYAIYIRRAE